MKLFWIFATLFGLYTSIFAVRLSNSKLVPADGMLCGAGKMGFKFSKSELIERFKSLSDHTKDAVEIVQVYVSGASRTRPEAICLYDPVLVEDRKSINAAIAEFEDGERGINITASPEIISLGNWIPYFTKERGELCVTSVKADTIVYFQSEIAIEVVSPASQAGGKIKLTIHCEMPRPQNVQTDLKVHRVDHIGSAVGEIPFSEFIQMKFVHPTDPTLAVTEVSLDDPVRLVLWKVRQDTDRTTLKTSIIPMHCELYSDNSKVSGITFIQNSCQAKTPAEIITSVFSKKTDVDGLEFREIFWTDFRAFRFDGSGGLLASCVVRICAKSHLQDCENKLGANGLLCFDEASPREMTEYPAITGESTEDGKPPEQPNPELELLRLAYPRKYLPSETQRYRRSITEDSGFVTIIQRLNVLPTKANPTNIQTRKKASSDAESYLPISASEVKANVAGMKTEMCFQSYLVYIAFGVTGWLLVFALVIIIGLVCYIRKQKLHLIDEKECQLSGTSIGSSVSYRASQPIRFR